LYEDEVAHSLGHNEEEVKELGLSVGVEDLAPNPLESVAQKATLLEQLRDALDEPVEAKGQQPRCLKCYSAEVTCHEGEKPLSYAGANLFDPITVHEKICTCNSCGYEWDDEDNI
jgi:hypothetical protein